MVGVHHTVNNMFRRLVMLQDGKLPTAGHEASWLRRWKNN